MKAIAMLIALAASAAFAQGASMNCRYGSSCSVGTLNVSNGATIAGGSVGTGGLFIGGNTTDGAVWWSGASPRTTSNYVFSAGASTTLVNGGTGVRLTIAGANSFIAEGTQNRGLVKFLSEVANGSDGYAVLNNGARWHFGLGASDYASSNGTTVAFAGPISMAGFTSSNSSSLTGGSALAMSGNGLAPQLTCGGSSGDVCGILNLIGDAAATATVGAFRLDHTNGALGATKSLLNVANNGTSEFRVLGNGDTTIAGAATVAGTVLSNANSGTAFKSAGVAFDSFSTCDSTQKGGTIFDTLNNEQRQCGGSKWGSIGAGSHWTSQRKTLVINPFSAEGTLCPRCTECHSTTLTAFDGQTCTDSAAGTTSIIDLVDFRNFNTTAVANNTSSWITRTTETRRNQGPRATFRVYVAAITSERVWYGLSSVALNGADAPVGHIAAFRFSTNATDTTWQACTGDGVTTTCANTGLTVTANVGYELEIDCRPSGSCFFGAYRLDGSASSQLQANKKTTNLPTLTTALSVRHYCETLTTAARTCGLGPSALETQ